MQTLRFCAVCSLTTALSSQQTSAFSGAAAMHILRELAYSLIAWSRAGRPAEATGQ